MIFKNVIQYLSFKKDSFLKHKKGLLSNKYTEYEYLMEKSKKTCQMLNRT